MTRTPGSSCEENPPATYFAPAARAALAALRDAKHVVADSPVLSAVMEVFGGWVAVLNRQRQVLAVNQAFLKKLGVKDSETVLGLRPGEMLQCAHANDHVGGCGTSKFCSTCGAALAIVAAQETDQVQERECIMTAQRDGRLVDHSFSVNCTPLKTDGLSLLLLSMRDISAEKRRGALERTFLHDISNVLTALGGAAEQLTGDLRASDPMLLKLIRESSETLYHEVRVQRLLCRENPGPCQLHIDSVTPEEIVRRIETIFTGHPVTRGMFLQIERPLPTTPFETDVGLLMRIMVNMTVNAFEASEPGDTVRIWAEDAADGVSFFVRSRPPIPENVAMRIFQRYFSTKTGDGRGLGTYAMKLLGETFLKGEVSFTNTATEGVTFKIRHPLSIPED